MEPKLWWVAVACHSIEISFMKKMTFPEEESRNLEGMESPSISSTRSTIYGVQESTGNSEYI